MEIHGAKYISFFDESECIGMTGFDVTLNNYIKPMVRIFFENNIMEVEFFSFKGRDAFLKLIQKISKKEENN